MMDKGMSGMGLEYHTVALEPTSKDTHRERGQGS